MLGGNERSSPSGGDADARADDRRFAMLAALARDVASAPRARELATVAVRHACALAGVRGGAFVVRAEDGAFEILAQSGPDMERVLAERAAEIGDAASRALRSDRSEWLPADELHVLPLTAGGAVLVLSTAASLEGRDRAFADVLGDVCARAFARAVRHESERSERIAAARLGVMLEAGQAMSRATDADEVLARLSELLVPRFADWATVDLAGADTTPPEPVLEVLRTGEPLLLDRIDALLAREDGALVSATHEAPGARSAMVVPLAGRQGVLGAMTLVSWREGLRYDETDLRLAGKIAQHAALALHNAHLMESERASRREAQTANRMKDAFLATVSHELRTPLHAILGWATLLRSGRLDDAGKLRAIETIERNARTQARLVDDVLDVSRIVSGKISLDLTAVEAQVALKQAVEVVQQVATDKKVTLVANIEPDLGRVRADRDRLVQVYWNVLSNAVKFTPSGGSVTLDARRIDGRVVVRITDTGRGIRKEFLAHLFEPFRQEDASTTRQHGGLGLGLSIARQLVRLHGGSITADSAGEGTGATFVIDLPSLER